nr:hypothetical protein [Candidatus Njordarchaeota archaeon]
MRGRAVYAQSPEPLEYAYLLGLYFTDGTLSKKGNCIAFALQGNEGEIIERVAKTLRSMRINAKVRTFKHNMVIVEGNAHNMTSFFPRKGIILNGKAETFRKFLWKRGLLGSESMLALAFLAGLMGGDGCCHVASFTSKRYRASTGSIASHWAFTAISYPVLAYYVLFAVHSLFSGSASGSVLARPSRDHVVRIQYDGIVQLLNHGFASFSFKARRWGEKYSELRRIQHASKPYYLRDVARLLGVSVGLSSKMFQLGLLGGKKEIYPTLSGNTRRYVFSKEEFNSLRERKGEILQTYYGDRRSLREVCRKLHICPDTGMKLFDAGVIKGEKKVYPSGQARYLIPCDEAISLLTKVKGRAKRVYWSP